MTHPCKTCKRMEKAKCPTYRECRKYLDWINAAWMEIQDKFAEIAAKGK